MEAPHQLTCKIQGACENRSPEKDRMPANAGAGAALVERTNTIMAFEFVHRVLVYCELAITKNSKASLNSDLALSGFSLGDGGTSDGHAGAGVAAVAALAIAQAVFFYGVAPSCELVAKSRFQLVRVQ